MRHVLAPGGAARPSNRTASARRYDVRPGRPQRDGSLSAGPSVAVDVLLPGCCCHRPARALSTKATSQRASARDWQGRDKQEFFARSTWKQLGASPDVITALQGLGITKPSHVQGEAYQAVLSGAKHVVIADHAGSGKTLAYLLPNIQRLKREEEALGREATVPGSPRMVVVCPTEELCAQVIMNCRALSKVIKFSAKAFTGGFKVSTQRDMLKEGVDVAVCTPGRLRLLMDAGYLRLDLCRALVLDEVDVLLGQQGAFAEQVAPLVDAAGEQTRFVLVTATLPEAVFQQLRVIFPGLVTAIGPNLHRTAVGITEQLVDCSGGTDMSLEGATKRKLEAMWAVMQQHRVPRTIVFCNKIETCRDVENFLTRKDRSGKSLAVAPHHAAVAPETRAEALRTFLRPPQPEEPARVLVCTDRASRGIDSVYTEHVILFDFPRDPSEYVRRVGRTARGSSGRGVVSVLVMGRQVKLAKEIIDRNQKGLPIHTVPTGTSTQEVANYA